MKKFIVFIVLALTSTITLRVNELAATNALKKHKISEEKDEESSVHRIMQLCKSGKTEQVKEQISLFQQEFPDSMHLDSMVAVLGDTYWTEKKYEEALKAYSNIDTPSLKKKNYNNYLDCLYHLQLWGSLAEQVQTRLPEEGVVPSTPDEELWTFYYAEAKRQLSIQNTDSAKSMHQLRVAQKCYETLLDTAFRINALMALVDISKESNQLPQSVDYLLVLAKEIPEEAEDIQFKAAQLQAFYNIEEALATYTAIQELGGTRQQEAVMCKIDLLFEAKQFQTLIDERNALAASLDKKKLDYFGTILGKSYFALGQYKPAVEILLPLLDSCNITTENQRSVFFALMAGYHQLNDMHKIENLVSSFEEKYPEDPAMPKLLFLKAQTYKNCEQYATALESLEELIEEFPTYDKLELVYHERNQLLIALNRFYLARNALREFIERYPDSPYAQAALQYIPSVAIGNFEEIQNNKGDIALAQSQLIDDLHLVLKHPEAVQESQKSKLILHLGKVYYDNKDYEKARELLTNYIKDYSHDINVYHAHLLMAMIHHHTDNDKEKIAFHTEKILEINPKIQDSDKLHMNLFTTYLQLSKEHETTHEYKEKAAKHLLALISSSPEGIKEEEKQWLANYYFDMIKNHRSEVSINQLTFTQKDLARKAIKLFEVAISGAKSSDDHYLKITAAHLDKECEIVKLAFLYGWVNESSKKLDLLTQLRQLQKSHPEQRWTTSGQVTFALAQAYEKERDLDTALGYYEEAVKSYHVDISNAAKLNLARLTFIQLPQNKLNLRDSDVLASLKYFKDLQVCKSLMQEPIHLEAAIDYARFRASLEPNEKRVTHQLFLLQKAKDEFTSKEDFWTKDYHASREQNPEQNRIFNDYIKLIEADIAYLEAKQAIIKGDMREASLKEQASLNLYKSLLEDGEMLTPYLFEQAQRGVDDIALRCN